jgi:hypothetical protein
MAAALQEAARILLENAKSKHAQERHRCRLEIVDHGG